MESFCSSSPSSSSSSSSSRRITTRTTSSLSSSSAPSSSYSSSSAGAWAERRRDTCISVLSLVLGKLFSAILTCFFALVGSLIGALTGAIVGQATESGLFRGAGIGALSGAVFLIEVFESSVLLWHFDESGIGSLGYMIDILANLLSGRFVRVQVGPVMLSAVERQINVVERPFEEVIDIFGTGGTKGLSRDSVEKLPKSIVTTKNNVLDASGERISCSVCLQDFQLGETVRSMPPCCHMFHVPCIDNWLVRHGSCPLCRRDIY